MRDAATGGSVMFSCDSRLGRANIDTYARDADLVFHDCEFNGAVGTIHTTLDELLGLDEDLQSRTLLVHYGDDWRDFEGKTGKMRLAAEGESYKV